LERGNLSIKEILQNAEESFGWQIKDLKQRKRGTTEKALAAKLLGRYSCLTNREIAPLLGLTFGSAVSWQRKHAEVLLKNNYKLHHKWKTLVEKLDQLTKHPFIK
jgi:hypothetical protein